MGCCGISHTCTKDEKLNLQKSKRRVSESKNFDIRKNYEFISILGNGAFGKVRLYRDKHNKDLLFAIKTLKKEGISSYEFILLKNEINILSNLDHPNIVKYFGVYEDDYYVHIVMEYLKGYDLYKIIALKNYHDFDEKDMCEIIYQLLKALSFIHSQNIIHRDIKPENMIFANKKDFSTLKLIDFGLATNSKKDKHTVGTPYYMAPEMIDGISCPKSDIWSVGVITYLMLTGKYPFDVKNDEEDLFYIIKNNKYDLKPLNLARVSEEAKDFIEKCLEKDFNQRLKTSEALEHEWINKFCIKKNSNLLNNDTIQTLLYFSNKDALQKEIYYFLAKISSEKDIIKLKHFFHELDKDNNGTLTIEEIEKGFKELNISITEEELKRIWEGLDFHNGRQIKYSEFLAAMVSSYDFQKEEKLWTVFNLFKEGNKKKNYITYESVYNMAKSLNLNINENEIKTCFKKYNKNINFEMFKKMILDSELEDKNFQDNESTYKSSRKSSKNM